MKLDAKFYGHIYKAKDDSPVHQSEWLCFLAKDTAFWLTLPTYREKCVELGADAKQIALVDEMILRVERWRQENPDRVKVPDAEGEVNLYDTVADYNSR